jgi:Glycosyltransferase Family 4
MGLRKYLTRFGWECVVITPKLGRESRMDPGVIETGYEDVLEQWKRKLRMDPKKSVHAQLSLPEAKQKNTQLPHTFLLGQLKEVLTYPDPMKGWVRFACEEIDKLADHQFDAIISTAPPISSHLVGRYAKKVLRRPWVADFRDLWTQNLESKPSLTRPFERRLEKSLVGDADALVTVSDDWAAKLRSLYRDVPVHAITNGFDPDDFPSRDVRLTELFTITYAGLLYQGKRDPTPLLEAAQELIAEGKVAPAKFRMRFYGPVEPWFTAAIAKYGLQEVTEVPGVIPRTAAIDRQRESQLLLQLGWDDRREKGQHTGKLFEYLGSRRPILALGGAPGAMSDVLDHTGAGVHLQTKDELKQYLLQSYREFEQNGFVRYHGKEDAIAQYSHLEMSRRFAALLDGLTATDRVKGKVENAFETVRTRLATT